MKKQSALKLRRDVIRQLSSSQVREAAGGSTKPSCYLATGASCDCTQICG